MENYNSREHNHVEWTDDQLVAESIHLVNKMQETFHSDARKKQLVAQLALVSYESEQRFLGANPGLFDLSSLDKA